MRVVNGDNLPEKKLPAPPRIFANTEENLLRSIERLSRWTLKKDVSPEQVVKVRATTGLLRLRVELARLQLDRERFEYEKSFEARLEAIEDEIAEQKKERPL